MKTDRRSFLRKFIGGTGVVLCGSYVENAYGKTLVNSDKEKFYEESEKMITGIFPFYKYLSQYNIGEYIPKDQGGKFVQMELMGTEKDALVVQKIWGGTLEETYGNPINWWGLEEKELEKSVWLNRFYYLPSFARMFFLTQEHRYFDYMMDILRTWIRENPKDGNKKESRYNWFDMQVAWRSINISWCYYLCEYSLTEDEKSLIFETLEEHGNSLLSHFGEQPLNEFNHQSHGALAMLYLGILFPSLDNSYLMVKTALKILSHHLENAFYSDGGNVEQMFGYYPFQAHIFRDTYLLCLYNNVNMPEGLNSRLRQMVDYISIVMQPDGTMPPVNDSYEMPALPILDTLRDILPNYSPQKKISRLFRDSQIGVIHSQNEENRWYVLLNPAKTIGAHAHAGRLSIIIWYNDFPLLVDSGCCNYDNPMLVSWYRTSRAHNTVLIDGKSDKETSSDTLWVKKRLTANRINDWIVDNASFKYCKMESPSSEYANSSIEWNRGIAIVEDKYVIIHDHFIPEDTKEHSYEILFHLPPCDTLVESKSVSIKGEEDFSLILCNKKDVGDITIQDGWVSKKAMDIRAPVASVKVKKKGVLHHIALLIPDKQKSEDFEVFMEETNGGTGILIKNMNKKTIVLIKNRSSKKVEAFGQKSSQLFDVY